MKTKNFAQFGLFLNEEFLLAGDMLEMLELAQKYASDNEGVKYTIATTKFIDSEEMTSIEIETEILNYRNINDVIYITT
ncbi:hypothetical protein [Bacteroides sp.]|jgi:hypothetical protein|uniref:hypothetical protein n=1 Tax=Bacteroides sp. TaxID=29523 RepID=UPI003D0D5071